MSVAMDGMLAHGFWVILVLLAIPGVLILFALIRKGDVRAALSLDRFSFKLEAMDRRSDLPPGTKSESGVLTRSDM
jgi:hypothetical protein